MKLLKMIEDLAVDYSNYIKSDLKSEFHDVQETIDDMLIRLDEFENLVNMVKADSELCTDISIPIILHSKQKLDSLCHQIDSLEKLVNRAKSDMEIIEMQVNEAETDIGEPSGKLKNIFKPLFFKKSLNETSIKKSSQTQTAYVAPNLFSTSSFFPSQNVEAVQEEKKNSLVPL